MLNRTGLCVLLAIAGAGACGGATDTDFTDSPGGGRAATGGSSGSAGSIATGGTGTGGTSGAAGSGNGGSGTGGAPGGGTGTGGSAGSAVGGTGTGGTGTGGTGTGGTGTGGSAGNGAGGAAGASGAAGTGMTAGGSAGMAGTAGKGSVPSCKEISAQHDAALKKAQMCNPSSGKEQCTHAVLGLGCDCPVFTNPDNESALAELTRLQKLWEASCPLAACPAIACVNPESGTCVADGANEKESGHCTRGLATPLD